MTHPNVVAFIEAIKAEHRELSLRFHAIQDLLEMTPSPAELPATAERLSKSLDDLRELLARHFVQEEQGGFLEEALVHAPQFSGQARQLMHEHADILRAAANVAAKAKECQSAVAWPAVAEGARSLITRLRRHEAAETQVLFSGFNIDPEIIS